MKIKKIKINTKDSKYNIYIGKNIINNIPNILKKEKIYFKKCFLVIDSNIGKKNSNFVKSKFKKYDNIIYNYKSSEKNKSFEYVNDILNKLLHNNFSRNDCVISIGGGITGDLVGFVSSIYKRGIKFINIPTTLLSQVDASVGGKTGINHKIYGKNLVGTFYQPNLVISDILFLNTLSKKEIICGYAEILKHSLISSRENFNFLNKNFDKILSLNEPFITKAIFESCIVKKKIVQRDVKEKNLRKILNLGHTFGHAYEATCGFKKKLNHGEGVILGIKTALKFSLQRKLINIKTYSKILNHVKNLNFGLNLRNFFKIKDINKLIYYMKNDKKNNSKMINLILLKDIGNPILDNLYSESDLKKFFKRELLNI